MHSAFPAEPVPCTVPAVQDPGAALAGFSGAGSSSRSLDCQSSPSWVSMMEAIASRSLSFPIANFSSSPSLSFPSSQPGASFAWPFDAQTCSALAWAPDTRLFHLDPPPAPAVKAPATRPKHPGRRLRQPAAICSSTAKATAASKRSASNKSAPSSASSSTASSPSSSRGISPRSKKMPGRPPKRPASNGDDESGQAAGKVKLPRLERGPDDFSSVVKNRLQSYTRTGQACDRCKVRKIRCDALPEGCSHCTNQNLECYVTDRVTGRTERRGYMQELEREKNDMLSHIRNLEKLLGTNGVEVKPWQWTPYAQYPPGVSFDDMGNPIPDPNTGETWSQVGSAWVKNDATKPKFTPSFPRSLLESRPQESHLGVGGDSAPLSSIKGTRLSILGMTVDLASFQAPDIDLDEPPADAKMSTPLYNKSPQAFLQSIMGVNPPMQVDLPGREDAFTYAGWYFLTLSPFLPILHKPSFMRLLTRIYDEDGFQPSVAELVIVHMVFAKIYFQYGTRNWQQADQRTQLNELSNKHYHFALSKFFELTCSRDLTSVQAMAMIAVHTRAFPKPGCVSIICNLALQRALELNLHRESRKPGEGTNLQHELRKRAWWVILVVYIAVAGRRGRPMPITVEEIDVGFPEPIADELLSDEGVDTSRTMPCGYWPGIASFKIIPIYMEMYSNIYSVRRDAQNYVSVVNALETQIKNWEEELHSSLKLDQVESTDHRMPALYCKTWALEFRLCLRHPSVAMTTDKKMIAENMAICEDVSRQMLHCQLEIQKCKCLDTTWYQTSMYTAGVFTMLVAMWERRFQTTPEAIATLREEMNGWVGILEEVGALLASGPSLSAEIGNIIDRTIAWIEHDMRNKDNKESQPSVTPEIKQEQPSQPPAYPASQVQPTGETGGSQSEVQSSKGYFQDSSINGQAQYPALAYGEHTQSSMAPSPYETEAMFYSTSAQAAAAAVAATTLPASTAQANPLIAFASQPTQQVPSQPADMLWQGRGNTWHDWTTAIVDNQDRFSASALLTLGGSTRDVSTGGGVPGVGVTAATTGKMGKKRRGHPDIEEILTRPWCYYCERDFEDLKLLISHQKAKHFKCDRCGRRLNTAGGLSVHMNQVHKENLSQVENALPNRQGLEVEIFGMEGIPQDMLDQHRNRILQNFQQAQKDRQIATGNPLPGQAMNNSRKKLKVESTDELKKRLEEFRSRRKDGTANAGADAAAAGNENQAAFNAPPYQTSPAPYDQHAVQPAYPAQAAPAAAQPYGYPASSLPARPSGGNLPAAAGLPQRPTQAGGWNGAPPGAGDDIDQLIRMAEAGIKPPQTGEEAGDKKKKDKDKKSKMFYDDAEISPEERMAALPRYLYTPVGA
ncbi:Transcriptional activator acu-15 [Fusarium albosuccineum]|uniref:Transcriptional activator acu-15 n=1 Tax=Fusarium albosuccineum TaxID=1237068 RepID=A0A8H4LE18_9HYPO|nr:Transcriptional activator acu-15 [Fusarium albosuccineum]